MKLGPDISRITTSLGSPARTNMLSALMGGEALTASELAREAGVTPQTASAHLSMLERDGLLFRTRQGRHVYFSLSGHDVAEMLEQLGAIAERAGHLRTRFGPKDPAIRNARVCYDHLAGEAGVAMLDSLVTAGQIHNHAGSLVLTDAGLEFMATLGVEAAATGRRPLCKPCLDWSVRRSHLGGALGAALLKRIFELGWARRMAGTRIVVFNPPGRLAFEKAFALAGSWAS